MFQSLFNDEKNSQQQFWDSMQQNTEMWQYFISKTLADEQISAKNEQNQKNLPTAKQNNNKSSQTFESLSYGSVEVMTKYIPIILKQYFTVLLNEGSENVLRSIVPALFQRLNMVCFSLFS